MVFKQPLKVIIMVLAATTVLFGIASAQSAIDTLYLEPVPPDSFDAKRVGENIIIRWYAPDDSISSVIGTIDYRNWYADYNPAVISEFSTSGYYTGSIDRKVRIERQVLGLLEPLVVGTDEFIPLRIETIDPVNRTYSRTRNIGTNYYTAGDFIPMKLINEEPPFDTLDLGFDISFSEGIIDTSMAGAGALLELDLQDFEGFHVWKGLSPRPSEMKAIVEISKEDFFKVSDIEISTDVPMRWLWLWEYFLGTPEEDPWPRYDEQGREYYEWVDEDVYAGFTYYYTVTCYDRGYFKGFFQNNKEDNFICDEIVTDPPAPDVIYCEDVMSSVVMTVEAGGNSDNDMKNVYAVPNPYRTGTSAATSPAYDNFKDNSIKFFNVPRKATIKIFTVSGDLVWEGYHDDPDGLDGIITWNVRNKYDKEVGSGVYIYRCESGTGGSVYGRIVVIR